MPAHADDEESLVIAVQDVLDRYRDHGIEALAFAGALGQDTDGTFTFSTAGSCTTADELHTLLEEPPRLQAALRVADLFAREDVHSFLRALICHRAPPALDPTITQCLSELGLIESSSDGTWHVSRRGHLTYLVFFSIAGAHRLVPDESAP
jgi:hypothetical protein